MKENEPLTWHEWVHRIAIAILFGGLCFWILAPFVLPGIGAKTPDGMVAMDGTVIAEVALTSGVCLLFLIEGGAKRRWLRAFGFVLLTLVLQIAIFWVVFFGVYNWIIFELFFRPK